MPDLIWHPVEMGGGTEYVWIPASAGMELVMSTHARLDLASRVGSEDGARWIPAPYQVRGMLSLEWRTQMAYAGKDYYVYIMASQRNGTLYCGATVDLLGRVWQHKNDLVEGFTKKYGVHTLVYYEAAENKEAALNRERQIKAWKREWKLELIEKMNPVWADLYDELTK